MRQIRIGQWMVLHTFRFLFFLLLVVSTFKESYNGSFTGFNHFVHINELFGPCTGHELSIFDFQIDKPQASLFAVVPA